MFAVCTCIFLAQAFVFGLSVPSMSAEFNQTITSASSWSPPPLHSNSGCNWSIQWYSLSGIANGWVTCVIGNSLGNIEDSIVYAVQMVLYVIGRVALFLLIPIYMEGAVIGFLVGTAPVLVIPEAILCFMWTYSIVHGFI
jgi:hypothetical protein